MIWQGKCERISGFIGGGDIKGRKIRRTLYDERHYAPSAVERAMRGQWATTRTVAVSIRARPQRSGRYRQREPIFFFFLVADRYFFDALSLL